MGYDMKYEQDLPSTVRYINALFVKHVSTYPISCIQTITFHIHWSGILRWNCAAMH